MNIIIYLIIAAIIGWMATVLVHDHRSNLLLNMIVAVVGAFLAGYFPQPHFQRRDDQGCNHSSHHVGNTARSCHPTGNCSPDPPQTMTPSIFFLGCGDFSC